MSISETHASQASPRHIWYFVLLGVDVATAIILFGTLPRQFAGLALVGGALLVVLIDLIARRSSESPLRPPLSRAAVTYLIVLGVCLLLAIGLVWGVVWPSNADWLLWVLAVALFLLTAGGAFVRSGRAPRKSATSVAAR
ncbi:MAG: hypothetical protein ACTHMF_12345 [Leifsonia sp.]|uniref:hypothetical protein n=1 Tax=Leifsonia sp. TaxID=1870902 RepID=UPI003F8138D6